MSTKQVPQRRTGWPARCAGLLIVLAATAPLAAQDSDSGADASLRGANKDVVETRDGVYLTLTYWSARNASKDAPVALLIPDLGRTQRDWYPIAKVMHDEGFAVLTFDWRGHGESKLVNPEIYKSPREAYQQARLRAIRRATNLNIIPPGSLRSRQEDPNDENRIDWEEEFKARDFALLPYFLAKDLETVKQYLIEQNNGGRLNVRKLGVVAADQITPIVMDWVINTELRGKGKPGFSRLGADIHAMVLITPTYNYRGLKTPTDLGKDGEDIPIMLIGTEGSNERDTARLARTWRIPDAERGFVRSEDYYRDDSILQPLQTKVQGMSLIAPRVQGNLDTLITAYLKNRLEDPTLVWERRDSGANTGGFGSALQ